MYFRIIPPFKILRRMMHGGKELRVVTG
jgi:hypothetical protein